MIGYYDVYALNGYTWVEVYVDDIGWLELEPIVYSYGPAVDNETLSTEQINDYMERQLRLQQTMGETDISFEILMSAVRQVSYLVVTWAGAKLKHIFIDHWPLLLGLCVILLCFWKAWPHVQSRCRALKVKRRLDSTQAA